MDFHLLRLVGIEWTEAYTAAAHLLKAMTRSMAGNAVVGYAAHFRNQVAVIARRLGGEKHQLLEQPLCRRSRSRLLLLPRETNRVANSRSALVEMVAALVDGADPMGDVVSAAVRMSQDDRVLAGLCFCVYACVGVTHVKWPCM